MQIKGQVFFVLNNRTKENLLKIIKNIIDKENDLLKKDRLKTIINSDCFSTY